MLFGGFTEETKFTSVRQTQNNKHRETNTRKSRARHHFWMGQSMNGYRLPGEITRQQSNMDVENPADIQFMFISYRDHDFTISRLHCETMISPFPISYRNHYFTISHMKQVFGMISPYPCRLL